MESKKRPVKPVLIALAIAYLFIWLLFYLVWGRGYPASVASTDLYKSVLNNEITGGLLKPPRSFPWTSRLEKLWRKLVETPEAERTFSENLRFQREYSRWLFGHSNSALKKLEKEACNEACSLPEGDARRLSLGKLADWSVRRRREGIYESLMAWLNVLVLVFLFRYFAWGAMVGFLRERSQQIKKDLDGAQANREKHQSAYLEIRRKLDDFDRESARIIEDAEKTGQMERARLAGETVELKMRIDALEAEYMELELLRARQSFTGKIVERACGEAERILRKTIKKADQKRLLKAFVSGLDQYRGDFVREAP